MLRILEYTLPSKEQVAFAIQGMRNAMNSWDKSDTLYCDECGCGNCEHEYCGGTDYIELDYSIGNNDYELMKKLVKAGTDHRKFMRMLPVGVRIEAPLYWWKEADTYKVGTTSNSCSTMHKIHSKPFTELDFSCEKLCDDYDTPTEGIEVGEEHIYAKDGLMIIIDLLNHYRELYLKTKDKEYWYCMIQLLPSSYEQTRNITLNFEVLHNIYHARKNHKLDDWKKFCEWIESIPYSELITEEWG